ncbi:MAG: hypothetical protein V9G19_16700 [Tetrasphaera sp.]
MAFIHFFHATRRGLSPGPIVASPGRALGEEAVGERALLGDEPAREHPVKATGDSKQTARAAATA